MPRINPVENPEGPAKEILEAVQSKFGMVPNIAATMAHSPAALKAYLGFGEAIGGGSLSAPLREQIALTVAAANKCAYCAAAHTAIGKMVGASEEELASSLGAKSSDAKTQAALAFARSVVENRGWVSDEDVAAVREAGHGDTQIVEIIAVVAINTFSNYFNHIAGTEVDFPPVDLPHEAIACTQCS